jgi:hypothetical protein
MRLFFLGRLSLCRVFFLPNLLSAIANFCAGGCLRYFVSADFVPFPICILGFILLMRIVLPD